MWTLIEGISLINQIKEAVEKANFSIALTGGVLFRQHSEKDLDLVFYPMNRIQPDYREPIKAMKAILPIKSIMAVNHPVDCKLVFAIKLENGKRIDVFFPGYKFFERTDQAPVAGSKYASGSPAYLNA